MFRKITLWALVAFVMVVIFNFSAQQAPDSNKASMKVTEKMVNISPKIRKLPAQEKQVIIKKLNSMVRKCAHFFMYFLLGLFVFFALSCHMEGIIKTLVWALLICLVYAILDEVHQFFVPGRGCQLMDILIDSGGSLLGCLLAAVIERLSRKLRTV